MATADQSGATTHQRAAHGLRLDHALRISSDAMGLQLDLIALSAVVLVALHEHLRPRQLQRLLASAVS